MFVSQAYLWDNNQAVVEWLEKHLAEQDGIRSTIHENIKYLKRESTLKHIRRYSHSHEYSLDLNSVSLLRHTSHCCYFQSLPSIL